jgi:hypothetical protein
MRTKSGPLRTGLSLANESGCHDLATGPTEGKQLARITCMAPKTLLLMAHAPISGK